MITPCFSHPTSTQAHTGYWKSSEKRSAENRNVPLEPDTLAFSSDLVLSPGMLYSAALCPFQLLPLTAFVTLAFVLL